MQTDWRRQALRLSSVGDLSEAAVRSAYWRLIGAAGPEEKNRLREAKRQLLFQLGVRVPAPRVRVR